MTFFLSLPLKESHKGDERMSKCLLRVFLWLWFFQSHVRSSQVWIASSFLLLLLFNLFLQYSKNSASTRSYCAWNCANTQVTESTLKHSEFNVARQVKHAHSGSSVITCCYAFRWGHNKIFWHLSLPPPLMLLLSSSLTPFLASCCCSFASHCSRTAPVVQLRLGSLQDAGKVPYPHQLFHKSPHTFSLKRARQLLKTLENDSKVPSQVFSPHSVFLFCFVFFHFPSLRQLGSEFFLVPVFCSGFGLCSLLKAFLLH